MGILGLVQIINNNTITQRAAYKIFLLPSRTTTRRVTRAHTRATRPHGRASTDAPARTHPVAMMPGNGPYTRSGAPWAHWWHNHPSGACDAF